MAYNLYDVNYMIEKVHEKYSKMYERLYSIYDRACEYDSEDHEKFYLTEHDVDTIDFWLDYIVKDNRYLDSYTFSRVLLQMSEIMRVIGNDPTSIEFKLKYNPKNWYSYLDHYGHYLRYPERIKREKLFRSKEEILREYGFN